MCLKSILFLVNREAQKLKSVKHSSHFQKIVNRAKIPPYPPEFKEAPVFIYQSPILTYRVKGLTICQMLCTFV